MPGAFFCASKRDKMPLTLAQLAQIVPRADAAIWLAPLEETMGRYQINTPLRQAHFLAQVAHESGGFRYRREIASGEAYEGRANLGNTQRGDGKRYKGRGLIQLTGRANYTDYTRTGAYGLDVVVAPDLVATDDRLCVDVAGWYWQKKRLNAWADADDLETITRRVNGGLNGLAERRAYLDKAKRALGVKA